MKPIKKILVPTDFSACAASAEETAIGLARSLGAEVTLVHAYLPPVYPIPDGGAFVPGPETLEEMRKNVLAELETARRRAAAEGFEVTATAVDGPSAEAIAEEAKRGGYDLIVMGTHGRTGLRHLLLGSVAEQVVRRAHCPVMTVRSP